MLFAYRRKLLGTSSTEFSRLPEEIKLCLGLEVTLYMALGLLPWEQVPRYPF